MKVLTEQGKKRQELIKNIDKDLSKDDQQKAREDIDEMFKGKVLFEMKDEPAIQVQHA